MKLTSTHVSKTLKTKMATMNGHTNVKFTVLQKLKSWKVFCLMLSKKMIY